MLQQQFDQRALVPVSPVENGGAGGRSGAPAGGEGSGGAGGPAQPRGLGWGFGRQERSAAGGGGRPRSAFSPGPFSKADPALSPPDPAAPDKPPRLRVTAASLLSSALVAGSNDSREDGRGHARGITSRVIPVDSLPLGRCDENGVFAILRNKLPRWNDHYRCWCLDFQGRVTLASVKNFQLVLNGRSRASLLFGRVGPDMFVLDYQTPLSAVQVGERKWPFCACSRELGFGRVPWQRVPNRALSLPRRRSPSA